MRKTKMLGWMALVGAVAACAPAADDSASAPSGEPGTFIGRLGEDTLFFERFVREGKAVHGEVLARQPQTHRIVYTADLDEAGHIVRMEGHRYTPEENPQGDPPARWTVTVAGDQAVLEFEGPDGTTRQDLAVASGVIPSLGRTPVGVFSFDQAARQAVASGEAEHPVTFVSPNSGRILENTVTRVDERTVAVDFFGNPFTATVGADGGVAATSGAATTMKVEVTPASAPADFDALASAWATLDAEGRGFGVPSPPAVTRAQVHGATLAVEYSQPGKRGREVWGGLVPLGQVWRTGANAATQLTVDRDLVFGDQLLPAGSYTLWSTYEVDGQDLVINAQTGQWGTAYDAAQDLMRVGMSKGAAPEFSERFTIGIDETPEGGVLHLTWDQTRFSLPFQVR